jgi:prevent-host-death family protein
MASRAAGIENPQFFKATGAVRTVFLCDFVAVVGVNRGRFHLVQSYQHFMHLVDLVYLMDQSGKMVNVHEAKTQLSKLLERAERGEEIIIARSGKPVAKLVPIHAMGPRKPGLLVGGVPAAFFEPLPDDEVAGWECP